MKTSIATVSISGDLKQKLEAIAKAGFDGVEIFENDFLTFDESPRQVGQMVRDFGMEISLFQPFRDFEGMPEPLRSRTFDRAERKFDLMQELGTDLVLVCSNVSTAALGGLDRAADDFRELGERAAKRNLRIGYEALAWGRHINDHRDAWEIVRRADHSHVGLILDSFHSLARKIDVNSIRSIPKEKLFFVQLADAPQIDMDLLYWSRHYRNMPGEGDLPVLEFMRAVAATGYDGYLSLEIFNDQFRRGSPSLIAADGYRSLMYLGDQVRRTETDHRLTVKEMPDRAKVTGVSFIEFTTNAQDAEQLTALLKILGFSLTGQHRSKNISIYQQNNINLVINADPDGYAGSAYAVHGTAAYAVGLMVEDAKAATKRALALGAELFVPPASHGARPMNAIWSVGGGIIYFLDHQQSFQQVFETEFEMVKTDQSSNPVGLKMVDHIAQTTPADEILSWVLFYTSLLETQKKTGTDIVDPAGVVRSEVIENESASFRVTLNGADNKRTLAGRFISETLGAGIQHLAFATDDIFATASALKNNGFMILEISANYYDDLEARFGLEPDFTEKLKAANILYDRDDHGEYYQLYSPTDESGFFFEIVQRCNYKGYGAANAIFRIAALRRFLRPAGMPRIKKPAPLRHGEQP